VAVNVHLEPFQVFVMDKFKVGVAHKSVFSQRVTQKSPAA
jgi:hypothetical protein